jgi:hypothetical protein
MDTDTATLAADYLAARLAVHTALTMGDRARAERAAARIVRDADRAGLTRARFDEVALDTQARELANANAIQSASDALSHGASDDDVADYLVATLDPTVA